MDRLAPSFKLMDYPMIDVITLMTREAPEHGLKLTEVFERTFLGSDDAATLLNSAHDALADCHMTARVLIDWFRRYQNPDPLEVAKWCNTPQRLRCMPFGKYKGVPVDQVPKTYISWAKAKWTDMSPDLALTMETL
jgi:exodeoxyribonuclease X